MPNKAFVLGGSGWQVDSLPLNVRAIGHIPTALHNDFNATPLAVLNIARSSMAVLGYSPATRVFEAAGAGACIITDDWEGIDHFLEPGREILVARDGAEVVRHVLGLSQQRARAIGAAARERVLAHHTYDQRADDVMTCLSELAANRVGAR
jgi:spore maturation protein CgeB